MDAGIDEKVQHLQLKLGVVLDFMLVKRDNVVVTDAETGGIELESGFLLCGDANANLTFCIHCLIQHIELMDVVQNGDCIAITFVQHHGNIVDILLFFETVADDEVLFIEQFLLFQNLNQVQIEGRRGLNMDVIFQYF